MSTKLSYLASPYSAYKGGRDRAFKIACKAAAQLMLEGKNIFCPIAHSHSVEVEAGIPVQEGDWWLKQDFAILEKCSELLVLQMDGWDRSYGVGKEIEFAKERKIPIVYLHHSLEMAV